MLLVSNIFCILSAVKLVKIRAEAMQLASEMEKGAMATIFYGPDTELGEACKAAETYAKESCVGLAYCGVANYLFPHCKIVAGNEVVSVVF